MDWRTLRFISMIDGAYVCVCIYLCIKREKIPMQFDQISNPIAISGDDLIPP